MLSVHPSGFFTWVKEPLSQRAQEDQRQTKLVEKAWKDSGKIYGYHKIYDDLIDMGETLSENRVARWPVLQIFRRRSATRRSPAFMAANPPSSWTTHWIGSSPSMRQIALGSRMSLIFAHTRVLHICAQTSTCSRGASSAGRCNHARHRNSQFRLCSWPSGVESPRRDC